jgi:hypothetical protein
MFVGGRLSAVRQLIRPSLIYNGFSPLRGENAKLGPTQNIIWSWFWSEFAASIFLHAAARYPM